MSELLWKWRREIIFLLLVLLSTSMLVSRHKPGLINNVFYEGISLLVVPFQKVSTILVKKTKNSKKLFSSLKKLQIENEVLKRKNEKLNLKNMLLLEKAQENEGLRQELGYKKETKYDLLPAEIVGRDYATWLNRFVLDRGQEDNLRVSQGVVSPYGVVGRVIVVNFYSATVMSLLDAKSSVAGLVERSQVAGTVVGGYGEILHMKHVSATDDVKVEDVVVTSTLSSIFKPGLIIGDIVEVATSENGLMLEIVVKPRVDFKKISRVFVVQTEE